MAIIENGGGVAKIERKEAEPKVFSNTIVAVDVDGVLVRPLAYRQAINKTVNFFADKLGISPDEYTLDDKNETPGRNMGHFEGVAIHDPWDVSAIIVSLMRLKKENINVSCAEALQIYKEDSNKNGHPPETVLNELKTRYGDKVSREVFEEIAQYLTNTRDAKLNDITGVFQEYILGGEIFEKTYGKKSQTNATEPLIQTQDELLINFDGLDILKRIEENEGKIVIYTARPGLPPSDVARERADGYSPEAELAIEKSHIDTINPVTMGSMQWLAEKTGNSTECLTKPNPTQAVAVILSALRGETDSQLLIDAYKWVKEGILPKEILKIVKNKEQKALGIVVIEDSTSGVIAFLNARRNFDTAGLKTNIVVIGVHGGKEEKYNGFKKLLEEERELLVIMCTTMNDGIKIYYNLKQERKI